MRTPRLTRSYSVGTHRLERHGQRQNLIGPQLTGSPLPVDGGLAGTEVVIGKCFFFWLPLSNALFEPSPNNEGKGREDTMAGRAEGVFVLHGRKAALRYEAGG